MRESDLLTPLTLALSPAGRGNSAVACEENGLSCDQCPYPSSAKAECMNLPWFDLGMPILRCLIDETVLQTDYEEGW